MLVSNVTGRSAAGGLAQSDAAAVLVALFQRISLPSGTGSASLSTLHAAFVTWHAFTCLRR